MKIIKRLVALPLTALASLAHAQQMPIPTRAVTAAAARANAEQNQQVKEHRESQQRAAAVNAPSVRSTVERISNWPELPVETPCFRIESFVLDVPVTLPDTARAQGTSALSLDRFAFAREWVNHYAGACIGKQGLDAIVKGLQQAILSRGYITTRVLLPEQDLSTGTLKFALVPGIIGRIRFADNAPRDTWKSAFPTRDGNVLNLRDLEQGLEQMKRVSSQDVSMQIVPANVPGESDVVLEVKRTKPWTVVASIDNSGQRATGRLQGNLSLGIDNPLGLNDIFNVGVSQDLEFGDKRLGSHGWNGSYSIPWGYWTGTLSAYTNSYYQPIAGANATFVSTGNSQTVDFKLQRVLMRSQNNILGAQFRLTKRFGESFIEDTDIPQQHRNNTFIEAGLTDRHYFGASQFDGSLAYRQGIAGLGATPDYYVNGPTYRFHMAVLDANLSIPFQLATQTLRYVTSVHGQFTNYTLNYIDDLTIGSRYTVRGFDGETMLAAERGFYWRNEFQLPINSTGQSLYAGIDYGHVFGPNAALLVGTQLAGAVIGIRGSASTKAGALAYDLFAGTPIYKPSGFPTARVTLGFQVTAQF
jgi:hemolysin activation/secretion protein